MALFSLCIRFIKLSFGLRRYSSCIQLNYPYIISAVRTPIGSFQGQLSSLTAVQLGSSALSLAVEKAKISKEEIQELVLGLALPAGLGHAPDRQVALSAGLPNSVVCSSVNKVCASGLKAVITGSQTILSNTHEVVVTGGIESLSNVPYMLRRQKLRIGNLEMLDLIFRDATFDFADKSIDLTAFAEITAKAYNISREEQDEFGLSSYSKAATATKKGNFLSEIVPIVLKNKDGCEEIISEDEEIRRLKVDKYRNLKPDMGEGGTITVGNSAGLCDGAAMLILGSGNYILKKNLTPLARIVSFADGSVDPQHFCIAPAVAVPKALLRASLSAEKISLWELHETFSLTTLINMKLLKLDPKKVNIHGGAVALGHPFGASGVRLIAHLTHSLKPGEFGCAAISHAGGGGSAVIIERI